MPADFIPQEDLTTLETLMVVKIYLEWLKDPTSHPDSDFHFINADNIIEILETAIDREQSRN